LPATAEADVDLWTAKPFTMQDDWKKFVIKHDDGVGRTRRLVTVHNATREIVYSVVFVAICTAGLMAFLFSYAFIKQHNL
jgi:hypothetical protein